MMSTTFQLSTVFTRLPSFESLKKKFLAKDPLEKWNYVRNINSFLLKVIGCDFLNGNYTYTLNTLLPVFLFVDYFCLMLYTLYYYRNEPLKALESTPMAGIMFPVCIFTTYSSKCFFKLDYLQCLIMFIFVLMKSTRAKMDHLYKFGGNYIFANSQITPKIRIICDKMAISLFTSSVKVNALLALSLFIVSILPLYHTFLGENEMIIPIILPFVDPDTEHGFFINLINQLIFICLGIDAIPACETFFCVLKNTITTTATVIEISIQDFKQLVAEKKGFSAERCRQFRNIIMKIMDFNRFDNFP